MKVLATLSLMALISACGKVNMPEDRLLGTTKSLSVSTMAPGSREYRNIQAICNAFQTKENDLTNLVGRSFTFGTTTKTCTDAGFTAQADTTVTIVKESGEFLFKNFYFPDVETKSTGLLREICAQQVSPSGFSSPISTDTTNLVYFTTLDLSGTDCLSDTNEFCIKVEKAVRDVVEKVNVGRVHTREWLKVKVNPSLAAYGFYSFKKQISLAGCAEGSFYGRTATLK